MTKKILKIILTVFLLLLIGAALWLHLSLNGSLIKKLVTTKLAEKYVQENYPDIDLKADFAAYDFKLGRYSVSVHSPEGGDLRFSVYADGDGQLKDDFAERILAKENTIERLNAELDACAKEVLKERFPHRTSLAYCRIHDAITAEMRNQLQINGAFSPEAFSLPCEMVVWTETAGSEPTWEEMYERLKELRSVTKERLPFVTVYSLSIQGPYAEKDGEWGPADPSDCVSVFDVPAEVIDDDAQLKDRLTEERLRQEAEAEALRSGGTGKENHEDLPPAAPVDTM